MTRTTVALMLSTALALAACQNKAATNNAMATNNMMENNLAAMPPGGNMMTNTMSNTAGAVSATDTAFVTDAMKGDNSEVALGKIAASKGSSQGVKDLGNMLVTDHSAHRQQLTTLAQQVGVPATDAIKDEARTEETKLNGLSSAAFDTEFVRATIEDHQKDIAAYQKEANGTGPVADMARQTIPTLKKHLAAAQALQK